MSDQDSAVTQENDPATVANRFNLLVVCTKDTRRYYHVPTIKRLYEVAVTVLKENLESELYDGEPKKTLTEIRKILKSPDAGKLAWRFLLCRSNEGYEYETIHKENLR